MKKKIITVTCNSAINYGAILQTYGLYCALKKMSNVEVLNYAPGYYEEQRNHNSLVKKIIQIPNRLKGKFIFNKFEKKYIKLTATKYRNNAQLLQNPPFADVYIAGSDQIWNCNNLINGEDDTFFLNFVPEGAIRASYAASIAMNTIPERQKQRYRELLSKFEYISVREPSSIELLNSIGIDNVFSNIDPVFLLEKEEWDNFALQSPINLREKYVLVYGYAHDSKVFSYAKKLAKQLHVKVYSIGTSYLYYCLSQDKYFWCVSPNSFVDLIKNAEAVITNSFHGTAFSLIFNVPLHFFTVSQNTNARMLDLLNLVGMSERRVLNGQMLTNNVNFDLCNRKIKEQRSKAIDYLQNVVS